MFKISVNAKYTSNPIKITKKEGGNPVNINGAEAAKVISNCKSDLFSFTVCTESEGPTCLIDVPLNSSKNGKIEISLSKDKKSIDIEIVGDYTPKLPKGIKPRLIQHGKNLDLRINCVNYDGGFNPFNQKSFSCESKGKGQKHPKIDSVIVK